MAFGIEVTFCTYFKRIEHFRYVSETYEEWVAFCVKAGSFSYQIGDAPEQIISEGEIVICPPSHRFSRKIIEPAELCMIKFLTQDRIFQIGKAIKVSSILRFHEDLCKLEGCLFCNTLSEEAFFSHYCMDILYLAMDSIPDTGKLSEVKKYIEQNYDKNICIHALAEKMGYTAPYLINTFKLHYKVTPKAYMSQIKVMKAKELLLTTDKLSREIAYILGFSDELYFIRFFKKHTGFTPTQFRQHTC